MGNLTGNGWTVASQESVLSLIVVLGSSVSLVGLIFAFITYRYDLHGRRPARALLPLGGGSCRSSGGRATNAKTDGRVSRATLGIHVSAE